MAKRRKSRIEQSIFQDVADIVNKTITAFIREVNDVMLQNTRYAVGMTAQVLDESFLYLLDSKDSEELKKRLEELSKRKKDFVRLLLKLK